MLKTKQKTAISKADVTEPAIPGALPPGTGVTELESSLRQLATTKAWNVNQPLPTTRVIGDRYRISNASVCRLLMRLDDEGIIWRRENGRYFLNESRLLFERHKPYACLLRKLQSWSRVYQGIMSGFTQAFGNDRASMLFVHNESLVQHLDTTRPPVHASAAVQRESLTDFFRHHSNEFRGILLDEVWLDDVLKEFSEQLTNAVIVCRPSVLPGLGSVITDFDASALLVIGHLYARGYDEIWLAIPFTNSVSVDLMAKAASKAAALLGKPIDTKNICVVASPSDRERFLSKLKTAKARVGVFCLEDNMALLLRRGISAADIECPAKVGLISAMGTDLVVDRQISSLQVDFEKIGHTAGQILSAAVTDVVKIPPKLFSGTTT